MHGGSEVCTYTFPASSCGLGGEGSCRRGWWWGEEEEEEEEEKAQW